MNKTQLFELHPNLKKTEVSCFIYNTFIKTSLMNELLGVSTEGRGVGQKLIQSRLVGELCQDK